MSSCTKCKKFFTTKSMAIRHEKTAKYCIKLDIDLCITEPEKSLHICEKCGYILSTKQRLQTHISICGKTTIRKPRKVLKKSELHPLTEEHIQESVKHLTVDHVKNGSFGISKFMIEYALKDRVKCVDCARQKIIYCDISESEINDTGLTFLIPKIFKAIRNRMSDIMLVIEREGNMSGTEDMLIDLLQYNRSIINGSNGVKDTFVYEVIKNVCIFFSSTV